MKKCVNGVPVEMTAEEVAAVEAALEEASTNAPDLTPTIEERVASVEEDTAIIRAILMGEEGETK